MQNEPEKFAEFDKSGEGLRRSSTDEKSALNNGTFPLKNIIVIGEKNL